MWKDNRWDAEDDTEDVDDSKIMKIPYMDFLHQMS